jgi:hypothetical protein
MASFPYPVASVEDYGNIRQIKAIEQSYFQSDR